MTKDQLKKLAHHIDELIEAIDGEIAYYELYEPTKIDGLKKEKDALLELKMTILKMHVAYVKENK